MVKSPCTNKNAARLQMRLRVGDLRFPDSRIHGVSRVLAGFREVFIEKKGD
jgi:hypothetical protein